MSLLDILGNYYDSATDTITKVADQVAFDIHFTMTEVHSNGIRFKAVAKTHDKELPLNGSYHEGPNLMNTCNAVEKSFFVNDLVSRSHYDQEIQPERFDISCQADDGTKFALSTTGEWSYSNFLSEWLRDKPSIPKTFGMSFKVFRVPNKAFRYKASLSTTGGKEPKDYFAEVCDASFDSSKNPLSKYSVKRSFKRGTVKYFIVNRRHKEEGIFLAEYLYGVKIPKNATYEEFFKRLANRPQTDFGIKDVQVLKSFLSIVHYNINPTDCTASFKALGVLPQTDLSRWYKKNEGLQEIVEAD